MTTYPVGAFFVTTIGGPVGYGIALAQALAGDPSRWCHAGIVVAADGTTVEAQPGGAVLGNLAAHAGKPLMVCDGPVRQAVQNWEGGRQKWSEDALRFTVATEAHKLIGTPYSFADYAALAALHLRLPSTALREYVRSSGHMICSQLVDAAFLNAGIHLFDDGRYPGDVAPADLASWAEDHAAGAS